VQETTSCNPKTESAGGPVVSGLEIPGKVGAEEAEGSGTSSLDESKIRAVGGALGMSKEEVEDIIDKFDMGEQELDAFLEAAREGRAEEFLQSIAEESDKKGILDFVTSPEGSELSIALAIVVSFTGLFTVRWAMLRRKPGVKKKKK